MSAIVISNAAQHKKSLDILIVDDTTWSWYFHRIAAGHCVRCFVSVQNNAHPLIRDIMEGMSDYDKLWSEYPV